MLMHMNHMQSIVALNRCMKLRAAQKRCLQEERALCTDIYIKLPRAAEAAQTRADSIELLMLMHMNHIQSIVALNRCMKLRAAQKRCLQEERALCTDIFIELPRAAEAAQTRADSIELLKLMHMDCMYAI
jgi:hypothetical protein